MYEAIYLILSQFWNFICHLITVFHAFQYLKGNWSSENKTFFLFLSMPGIIIAPNRNICYNSLITVFYIYIKKTTVIFYFPYQCFSCFSILKTQLFFQKKVISLGFTFQAWLFHPTGTMNMLYYSCILIYLSSVSMVFRIQKSYVLLENKISPSIFSMHGIIIPPYST